MINFKASEVVARASLAAYGKPLVTNINRGHLVEAMISLALEPDWNWCGTDYAGWDFVNEVGCRIEVKQSAAKQSWAPPAAGSSQPSFDIADRKGYWENGNTWIEEPGRNAHIYVMAYHGIEDDSADHRDPLQWVFYVLPTSILPNAKTISLRPLARLVEPCRIEQLKGVLAQIAATIIA